MTSMLIGLTVVFFKYKIWLLIFASIYILLCKTKISSQDTKVISFFIINLFLYILTIFVIYYNFPIDKIQNILNKKYKKSKKIIFKKKKYFDNYFKI